MEKGVHKRSKSKDLATRFFAMVTFFLCCLMMREAMMLKTKRNFLNYKFLM